MMTRVFQVVACALALAAAHIVRASQAYVENVIACSEAEEAMVSGAYDAFLGALESGQIGKEELRLPLRLIERRDGHVIFSRSYYVSPNELRGFELVIPASLLAEEDGALSLLSDLTVASHDVRQRITILVMKKTEANQRAEPTRGTPAENREARSQYCARRRVAHA